MAGPEAANNAAAAGVLVPLLTLGLPSSATAAVLLAAFQQYGLQPGPLLFSSRPDLVWTLIASLYIGNVMLLVLNLPLAGVWARVMLVPRPLLFGGILVLASLGAYSLNRSMLDLVLLYVVGAVGCAMRVYDVPLVPAVLGLVLGPLAEQQFRRALAISEGDLSVFVTRPICADAARCWPSLVLLGPARAAPRLRVGGRRCSDRTVRRRRASAAATPALCAALTARAARRDASSCSNARRAHFRGGNSRHTRNLRCVHDAPDRRPDRRVPRGRVPGRPAARHRRRDRRGARAPASSRDSADVPGVDAALRRALPAVAARHAAPRPHQRVLSRRRQGADEQLLRRRRAAAASTCCYDAEVVGARHRATARSASASVRSSGRADDDRARKAVVLAAGGFESNLEWLREVWGDAADNFIVRGTPYNTGTVLQADARRRRASRSAIRAQCHAVAIDARAPKFDGGIVTRLDCVPLGIVVNTRGERFYDEGEDFWPKRYAIWGRLVAQQPDQIAYSIVDAKVARPVHAVGVSADRGAARFASWRARSSLPPDALERDGRGVQPRGAARHVRSRACSTTAAPRGSTPDKTHWAQRARHAAVLGLSAAARASRSPISGVRVDERARVLMTSGDAGGEHLRRRRDHGRQHPAARATSPASA